MQHHDRRPRGIARAEFDDVKAGAGNLNHGALMRDGRAATRSTPACVTSASIASAATTTTATMKNA